MPLWLRDTDSSRSRRPYLEVSTGHPPQRTTTFRQSSRTRSRIVTGVTRRWRDLESLMSGRWCSATDGCQLRRDCNTQKRQLAINCDECESGNRLTPQMPRRRHDSWHLLVQWARIYTIAGTVWGTQTSCRPRMNSYEGSNSTWGPGVKFCYEWVKSLEAVLNLIARRGTQEAVSRRVRHHREGLMCASACRNRILHSTRATGHSFQRSLTEGHVE